MIKLQSPASVVFFVKELRKTAAWYGKVLGLQPYRDDKDFIGFHLGNVDLCFHRSDEKSGKSNGSQVAYWHVENLNDVTKVFIEHGATIGRKPIQIAEGGIVTQIKDPFGNILGLMGE
jgi:predicted enzyme related to lactoylglutathione lyase